MTIQSCDSSCSWCFRDFVAWWKRRVKSQDAESGRSGAGNFNLAAATSIKPPRDTMSEQRAIPETFRGEPVRFTQADIDSVRAKLPIRWESAGYDQATGTWAPMVQIPALTEAEDQALAWLIGLDDEDDAP